MFKKTFFVGMSLSTLFLTGCPEPERVRVVEQRRPEVVIEHREGEHKVEERREEIRR
jgi:hypothetical protein